MTGSARRPSRTGSLSAAPESGGPASASEDDARVTVEEIGRCFLLRPAGERAAEQADLLRELTPPDDAAVIVVAVPDDLAAELWPRLGELLARVRRDPRPVVLAMSGAANGSPGGPSLARRIADAWKLTVVAPAGDAVLVPGGLFAQAAEGEPEPQWWSFTPDTEPAALGPRWPEPEWRAALIGVASGRPADGVAVTDVPAGIMVRPAGTPLPGPGDLPHAIPAGDRPAVLVAAGVTASDLVATLSGPAVRPEWRHRPLRLVPVGDVDLLPLGQAVARDLGLDVEVLTGPPVDLAGTPREPAGRRVMVLDGDGRPSWSPYVSSVLCRVPGRDGTAPPPCPLDWRPPVAGMRVADAARGVLRLGDTWRVAVTRAGLWAYPADADPGRYPERLTGAWPVNAGTVRVDVGTADRTLDDRVWPLLDELLGALVPGPRARLHLAVHGATTAEGEMAVRALAAHHGAGVEPGQAAPETDASPVRAVLTSPAAPTPTAPEAEVRPPATESNARPPVTATAAVPITPAQPSTDEERSAFRALVGLAWDTHAAPVRRTFSRLPAIAATERAAAAVDLVAVRLYLTSPADAAFAPAAARSGDEALRPYLSCLASGLGRLPTYRGAVLHGVDVPVRTDLTGTVLTEPGPVGGLPLSAGDATWPPTATVYVIWSDTARRVAALVDADTETGPGAGRRGDVVFGPGSRFAVLDVRRGDADTPDLVLLRELPATAFPAGEETAAEDLAPAGRLALTRLDEALATARPAPPSEPWPAHCLGPIGTPPSASAVA